MSEWMKKVDTYAAALEENAKLKAEVARLNKLLDAAACDKCERKTVDDQRKLIQELQKVYHVAQAVLTGLNVGDVQKESGLHQLLRKTQIEYREFLAQKEGGA